MKDFFTAFINYFTATDQRLYLNVITLVLKFPYQLSTSFSHTHCAFNDSDCLVTLTLPQAGWVCLGAILQTDSAGIFRVYQVWQSVESAGQGVQALAVYFWCVIWGPNNKPRDLWFRVNLTCPAGDSILCFLYIHWFNGSWKVIKKKGVGEQSGRYVHNNDNYIQVFSIPTKD